MSSVAAIYVACLASYNAGRLHGEWLHLDDYFYLEDLENAVQEMLANSPVPNAEEYAIHDYEHLDAPSTLQEAWEQYELIEEYGDLARALLSELSIEETAKIARDGSYYVFDDYEEFGDLMLENEDIPSHLAYYIDTERYAQDILQDYHVILFDRTFYAVFQ